MIRLAKPFIPEEAIKQVTQILESDSLIQGERVEAFESALADYLGVKEAVLVSSGTAALHVGLIALGIDRGDEVLVPAFTFPASANVVELLGAIPVLVDIDLDDFCIDPEQIERHVSPRTKAVMPVHEFGHPADCDILSEIASRHGLALIEDAACALGSEAGGKKAGTWGGVGCFSFHPRKTLTTGEGGAVVTDDSELAGKVRSLRNHGILREGGRTDFRYAGLNYRMTDFQAALGLGQMPHLQGLIDWRRHLARLYRNQLSAIPWVKPPGEKERRRHSYQTYHILVDPVVDRNGLIAHLGKHGIETNIGAYALHCLTYYREKYGFEDLDFPKASYAYRNGLALPIGNHVSEKDVARIAGILSSFSP